MQNSDQSYFDRYRFNGFKYKEDEKFYYFFDQVNVDESKIILQVKSDALYCFYSKYFAAIMYMFKLDQVHFVYLREWQILQSEKGYYVLLDKDYWHVRKSPTPFEDMKEYFDCTWLNMLDQAKRQSFTIGSRSYLKIKK